MAQSSATFHEREDALKPETRDRHRAIVSIMEELEAVDWYDQRVDAAGDDELRAILAYIKSLTAPPAAAAGGEASARYNPSRVSNIVTLTMNDGRSITGERRSQGLGRRFWRLLHPLLRAQAWPTRVVFEVEDPDEAAGAQAERVIRQRRMAFWTACGARLLPAPGYVLPDYTGSGVTEPMLLMASSPPVDGGQLRQLVLAIYTDRYGLPPTDPLVRRALASIAA